MFGVELVKTVRRKRNGCRRLRKRKMRVIAINSRGTRINDTANPRLPSGLENRERSLHIDIETHRWLFDGQGHRDERGFVKHAIATGHGRRDNAGVANVSFNDPQSGISGSEFQVAAFSCGEVIQNTNLVAASEQMLCDVGSDKAGST